jgi:hypothetical protein
LLTRPGKKDYPMYNTFFASNLNSQNCFLAQLKDQYWRCKKACLPKASVYDFGAGLPDFLLEKLTKTEKKYTK